MKMVHYRFFMQKCNLRDKFVSKIGLKILILSAGMDAGNEKHSSDQCDTISVEAHEPSESMQEKYQGDQICDAKNLGTASGAEQGTVF